MEERSEVAAKFEGGESVVFRSLPGDATTGALRPEGEKFPKVTPVPFAVTTTTTTNVQQTASTTKTAPNWNSVQIQTQCAGTVE